MLTTLILAGSRSGAADPVAAAAGVSHKALAPIGGVPMVVRVVETLRAVPRIGHVAVAIERSEALLDLPALARLAAEGYLSVIPAEPSPSRSVLKMLERSDAPLLVTTADNALMTPEMVEYFLSHLPAGADAVAALARSQTIEATYPGIRRTYLRFSDGAYSGCNLFAFMTPAARRGVAFWRRVEDNRKRPLTMMRQVGWLTALRYAIGRLSLAQALRALGRRAEARLAIVDMPFAEAAIDVDKEADMVIAEAVLRRAS